MLQHYLPDLFSRVAFPAQPTPLLAGENVETKLHCTASRTQEITKLPECQMFIYVLVLMKLIDDGDFKNVSLALSNPVGQRVF